MMNKLANDIAAAVIYKLAALAGDAGYTEKDAGSNGINHLLRKSKALFKTSLGRVGTHPSSENYLAGTDWLDGKAMPGSLDAWEPFRKIIQKAGKGFDRQNKAMGYRKAIRDTNSMDRIRSTPQGRRAYHNTIGASVNAGQNVAFRNITGNSGDFIDSVTDLLRQDEAGILTPRHISNFLGIKNPEAEALNAGLIKNFGR